jgi:hypothetical protein
MNSNISPFFERPIFIYDNQCSPCWKYARVANKLSRGRIKIIGHYESSEELQKIKKLVFPPSYDPTLLSWLINEQGAYGCRAGLFPLIIEILKGMIIGNRENKESQYSKHSSQSEEIILCSTRMGLIKRIIYFITTSKQFSFQRHS